MAEGRVTKLGRDLEGFKEKDEKARQTKKDVSIWTAKGKSVFFTSLRLLREQLEADLRECQGQAAKLVSEYWKKCTKAVLVDDFECWKLREEKLKARSKVHDLQEKLKRIQIEETEAAALRMDGLPLESLEIKELEKQLQHLEVGAKRHLPLDFMDVAPWEKKFK